MRVIYDKQTDTLTIIFKEGKVLEIDEEKPGVILDYDDLGNIVSMEILDASQRIQQPHQMVYELAGLEQ